MESKKALLIYSPEDITKNGWFIRHLTEISKKRGISLGLLTPEDCLDLFDLQKKRNKKVEDISFVINRSRDYHISELFESEDIPSYNNSLTVKTGNDKYEEYLLFKRIGLETMETAEAVDFLKNPEAFLEITEGGEFVLKKKDGHGGSQVFKVKDIKECRDAIGSEAPDGWIVQRMCSDPGRDVRVYMIGEKICAAVLRTSDEDFRSNFSLGGKAESCEPDDSMKRACNKIANALGSDYIGVDFIEDMGRWVINEIEDAAGARMLYSLCTLDIAELFIEHICEKTFQI